MIFKIILYTLLGFIGLFLLCLLFLFICSLFVDGKCEYDKDSRFYRFLLYSTTAIAVFICRIKIQVTGLEKVPEDRRVLLISNHRSNFDPIVTWHLLKKYDLAYISKASNFKIPIWGRIVRRCCFMAINREDPRKAIITIKKAAELLKKDEVSIGIYPEGTRSKDCTLLPFKAGAFKIAQAAVVPVVVMTVQGTEKIHKNVPWRITEVKIDILETIPEEEVKALHSTELSGRVRAVIEQKLEEDAMEHSRERDVCCE